jgi:hypothetical protein
MCVHSVVSSTPCLLMLVVAMFAGVGVQWAIIATQSFAGVVGFMSFH